MNRSELDDELAFVGVTFFITEDKYWQLLGYPKAPSHGFFFNNFRSSWKVELEQRLAIQLLALGSACFISAGCVSHQYIVRRFAGSEELYLHRVCGLDSHVHFMTKLSSRLQELQTANPVDWHHIIVKNIDLNQVEDSKLQAKMFVSIAQLPFILPRLIANIKSTRNV